MPVNSELATKIWMRYTYARDNGHNDFVKKADVCDKFFRGDQWSADDLEKLRQSRRPALTINKIISTISNVLGEQIYNRAEISFRPRSGASDDVADVLNKLFKQIGDVNQLDWKRSDMFADGVITSRGFLDIRMCFSDSMQGNVEIVNLNPKNVIIDPDAEEYDPDGWNEVFTTKWVTIDDIELLYGKKEAELLRNKAVSFFPYGYDSIDWNRDRFGTNHLPTQGTENIQGYLNNVLRQHRVIERQHRVIDRQMHFVDPKTGLMRPVPDEWDDNRIALVKQQYGLEVIPKLVKRIRWTVMSDNVVLHDEWSPYKHFTIVPYFPYFRHGHTTGLVENLIGPQELLNKVSSQELHVINTTANSGWKVKAGSLTNMSAEELEQRGAETGLVIEVNGDPDKDIVKIQPNSVPSGLDRVSYKAEEHIKTISNVPDSVMGQDRADVAAKAIQQKRQAASTNQAKPMDSLMRTDYIIARNVLDMVQEFYTEERVVTITNDKTTGQTAPMTINQVTPAGQIVNDVTLGDFDVVVTSVPARETLEDSQFDQAIAMREAGINIPDKVLVMNSRLMNKTDILQQMDAQSQTPEAQAQSQLALAAQKAEVDKTNAEVVQKKADAGLKQAKAAKEAVATHKEATAPPEQEGNEAGVAQMMKAQADIDLDKKKFDHQVQIDREKMDLERKKVADQAAQQAVKDRVNRMSGSRPK